MKNSTKQSSKVKEPLVRNLGGLAFYPGDHEKRKDVFLSLMDWVEAKRPDNAYIYDTVEILNTAGIPIRDATQHRGLYTRIPRLPVVQVTVNRSAIRTLIKRTGPIKVRKIKGIEVAEVKEHHKMSY